MIAAARSPSSLRLLALASAAWLAATACAQDKQDRLHEDRAKGAATVSVPDCKKWLGTLASPEFEGRGTGQPGFEKAANFVAAHFRALGLEARGDNGTYFQRVPWGEPKVLVDKTHVLFTHEGKTVLEIPGERLSGMITARQSSKGDAVLLAVTVPAVPAPQQGQRNIALPKIEGLDNVIVKDKVVVVQLHGENRDALAMLAVQVGLQGKGAAALVFAQSDEVSGGLSGRAGAGGRRGPGMPGGVRQPARITFGGDDFAKFLAAAGAKAEAPATGAVLTVTPLQAEVELAILDGTDPAMNVWAVLPGSDAKLKDEYVVIGSHLDHLGKRPDRWYPGADDDGSGTTGVLAISQMFAKNPVKPARSILFVCFCGEENGLVGSGYFANNCPIPLSSIVGELQMDMIGRDEEEAMDGPRRVNIGEKAEDNLNSVHLVGTQKLAPSLHTLCLEKNKVAKFDIEYDQEDMFSRSDHANFAQKGVPVAFFFTGLHRDYHQPTDTPDKIHFEKLLRVATWVYDIAFELATQKDRPHIEPELWETFRKSRESRGNAGEKPAAPLTNGGASK